MKFVLSGLILGSLLIVSQSSAADLGNGLVAWYPLDSSALDSGPNAFHGIAVGTTAATDRNGNANSCLVFDGVLANIKAPISNLSSLSISVWMKVPSDAGDGNTHYPLLADLYSSTDDRAAVSLGHYIRPSLGVTVAPIWVLNNVHTAQSNLYGADHTVDTWYHVVYTYDAVSMTMSLYVDGVLENSIVTGSPLNTFDSLSIGADLHAHVLTHFAGLLDEVVIYNRVLALDEIQALNQGQKPVTVEEQKATICHLPGGNPRKAKTLSVGTPSVNAHLGHGDYLGPCTAQP